MQAPHFSHDPASAPFVANGWRIDPDGRFCPANIELYEYCLDASDVVSGRTRVLAETASKLRVEAALLDTYLRGEKKVDTYGAPLETETLLTNIAFYSELLRRLSVSDRWPDTAEITHIMRIDESSTPTRAYV